MKVIGKVHVKCDIISGQKTDGSMWKKQTLVIETVGDNPKKVAIDFFGPDRVAMLEGVFYNQLVEVVCVPESRVVNEKWFTSLAGISVRAYA